MRIIKKYSNRRLYDTQASAYVNLDALAALVREGEPIRVVDATTDEDLTAHVLLQILLESQGVVDLFPVGFLARAIRYSAAGPAPRLLLQQLSAGLALLDTQLSHLETQFGWTFGGGPHAGDPAPDPRAPTTPPQSEAPDGDAAAADAGPPQADDLAALRARLASLEARLDKGGA